jgi:hypothetical protein
MSSAVDLLNDCQYKEGICTLCGKFRKLMYGIHSYKIKNIRLCGGCYGDIPYYIPLVQDSQYIEKLLKKKL